MANEEWGPLAGLIGDWEGDQGLDVSFHNDKGKIAETGYFEKSSFKPFGPVDNGAQQLFGLDYRTTAWRKGEEHLDPYHTEVGYWLWDAANKQVMRCFMVPRGSTIIAGGTAEASATEYVMGATLGSTSYGILSNQFLDEFAKTIGFDVTIKIEGDSFSYDETTTVEHAKTADLILHTDRNTMKRVG